MSWAAVARRSLPALLWVALGIGWTAATYRFGSQAGRAGVQAAWQAERADNARAVANAIERQLDAERALDDALGTRDLQHRKELADVQEKHDDFVDGVRRGAVRVSIPVRAPACRSAGAAAAAAAGPVAQARAELEPAAAAALAAIARDGDSAIVDLNACIDRYNDVRAAARALSDAQAP